MRLTAADDVRAAIAAHLLGPARQSEQLGGITLYPHQREGADRLRRIIDEHRGALLADDVGLGKTFVALAVAATAKDSVVVAPAALREQWLDAAHRAGVAIRFASVEGLGGRGTPVKPPDLVVVDEAHHFRNPATRRFAAARTLCRDARVLLLTATPVQNRLDDLRVVVSLFLGERAAAMSEAALSKLVVRRTDPDARATRLPTVRDPVWLRTACDVDCLDRILALPPPLPPADAGDGGVLLVYTLVRQWASSRAALCAALRRRLARARALEDSLLDNRLPSRRELAAWAFVDGAQQLAFPSLMVEAQVSDAPQLLAQVLRHRTAVADLAAWLDRQPDPDASRAEILRELHARHPAERIVAFSEYADTVSALYRRLAPMMRVAVLTHAGGRVAGGSLTRREVLDRFGPGARSRTPANERIDLLLTTDVLSEGVNLQDASVAIHLDLTWNPARLAQRVGRLRRYGAARESVSVYAFAPPAPAEHMLRLEERLRVKLGDAARSVGIAGAILPGLAPSVVEAPAAHVERTAAVVRGWIRPRAAIDGPVAACVQSTIDGAIACVQRNGVVELVGLIGATITRSPAECAVLVESSGGNDVDISAEELEAAHQRISEWLNGRGITDVVTLAELRVGRSRRALLKRAEAISKRAARHARARVSPLLVAARHAARVPLSAGAEEVLADLTHAPLDDSAWLTAINEFASIHAPLRDEPAEVLALLVLRHNPLRISARSSRLAFDKTGSP